MTFLGLDYSNFALKDNTNSKFSNFPDSQFPFKFFSSSAPASSSTSTNGNFTASLVSTSNSVLTDISPAYGSATIKTAVISSSFSPQTLLCGHSSSSFLNCLSPPSGRFSRPTFNEEITFEKKENKATFYVDFISRIVSEYSDGKESVFYDQILPVKMQIDGQVTYTVQIHFFIILRFTTIGGLEVVRIELTREGDPFFLYTVEICKQYYFWLKKDQRIVVEFENFPQKFVEMLQQCDYRNNPTSVQSNSLSSHLAKNFSVYGIHPEKNQFFDTLHELNSHGLQCILNLDDGNGCSLCLIERNQFRELIHLCLSFSKADSESLKTYLARQLQAFKIFSDKVCEELTRLRDELRNQQINQELSRNNLMKEQRIELEKNISQIENEFQMFRMNKEGESLEKYITEISKMNSKIQDIELQNSRMIADVKRLETEKQKCQDKFDDLSKDLKDKENLIQTLQSTINGLNESNKGITNKFEELRCKYNGIFNDLNKTDNEIQARQDNLRKLQKEKEKLEKIKLLLQSQLRTSSEEIQKGNSIISKLQYQVRLIKSKLARRIDILSEKEKELSHAHLKVDMLNKDLSNTKDQFEFYKKKSESQNNEIRDLQKINNELVDEKSRLRKLNDHMNKELTSMKIELMMYKNFGQNKNSYDTTDVDKKLLYGVNQSGQDQILSNDYGKSTKNDQNNDSLVDNNDIFMLKKDQIGELNDENNCLYNVDCTLQYSSPSPPLCLPPSPIFTSKIVS